MTRNPNLRTPDNGKKVSKFFRIGVEGDTCDGRIISAQDIQEMAETFDPRVYGCRINLEHLRGILPDGIFKRYGDVVELKAEKIDDDSALKGKWALFAKITPTDDLIAMNKAAQKVYTSMEIQPNFGNSGKCYLVGLAVTDDPASLGTEYLEFCRNAKHNPLNRFKANPENLISAATLAELEFEDQPETVFTALTDKVKAIFSRKQVSDDARMNDVHEAVTAVSEHVQTNLTAQDKRLSDMETALATFKQELTGKVEETSQAFSDLKTTLDKTESFSQPRRTKASGGGGDELLTDC
ncbi:GPO family capsid scaffolding protein [Salmonella enterica subsp. enterica serovar Typhimurium]|nr:GPO family capsid scaffolding protein [Salmonella enterica subsp. enterica serovar Typhimurium]